VDEIVAFVNGGIGLEDKDDFEVAAVEREGALEDFCDLD
jgi:hypothetical protein